VPCLKIYMDCVIHICTRVVKGYVEFWCKVTSPQIVPCLKNNMYMSNRKEFRILMRSYFASNRASFEDIYGLCDIQVYMSNRKGYRMVANGSAELLGL